MSVPVIAYVIAVVNTRSLTKPLFFLLVKKTNSAACHLIDKQASYGYFTTECEINRFNICKGYESV